jgi:hypothetical protein
MDVFPFSTGIWTQGFMLTRQVLYCLTHISICNGIILFYCLVVVVLRFELTASLLPPLQPLCQPFFCVGYFLKFFSVLGFELRVYTLSHSSSLCVCVCVCVCLCVWWFFFFFEIGIVLGIFKFRFELRTSHLLGRYNTAWATPQLFCDGFFLEIGSWELFARGWLWTAILVSSWDYRHEPPGFDTIFLHWDISF